MRPYLYALGAIACWASLPAATGSALDELSVSELLIFSFVPAAIYLTIQEMILSRSTAIPWPNLRLCLLGLVGIFGYHACYYLALDRAPLVEGAILATTWSFWIVIFSTVLEQKRICLPMLAVALLGLLGAGLVVSGGQRLHFEAQYLPGYLLALTCGLIWSGFSVILARSKPDHDYMPAFTVLAACCSIVIYALSQPQSLPPAATLSAAIYVGLVPLGLSFTLWNRAITTGNMTVIGYLTYLTPPLAVLLAALIRGSAVKPSAMIGMVFILSAALGGQKLYSMTRATTNTPRAQS